MKEFVKINHVMLKDLCHDAGWRVEEKDGTIRVFHRYWGGDFIIQE